MNEKFIPNDCPEPKKLLWAFKPVHLTCPKKERLIRWRSGGSLSRSEREDSAVRHPKRLRRKSKWLVNESPDECQVLQNIP